VVDKVAGILMDVGPVETLLQSTDECVDTHVGTNVIMMIHVHDSRAKGDWDINLRAFVVESSFALGQG
jgi:hypothetical protein